LDKSVKIFSTPHELAERFAEELVRMIKVSAKRKELLSVALSGGSTPELLYSVLGEHFSGFALWEHVHFFWGDERCVPADNPDSNFGMAGKILLEKIDIPSDNIHRIKGEDDPEKEAIRYSQEIYGYSRKRKGLPLFDLIILGLGEDGHIASIFPGHNELFSSDKICEVAIHPVTLQKRITITGRIINNADSVTFMVTGKRKADIVNKIVNQSPSALNFPAYYVSPLCGVLHWYLDKDAGRLL
jgi:6-phosphogluconolactonase